MGIFDIKPNRQVKEERAADMTVDERIVEALRQVYDPEIPVNIYDMGLIYRIQRDEETEHVNIDMTLTSPNCPAAQELPLDAKYRVETVPGVSGATVDIVWDPPWGPEQMSEEAQMELGFI